MEGKVLARIAAIVFVAIAITATVIEMTREEAPVPASTAPVLQPSADPLRATLRRYQPLGEAAARDAGVAAIAVSWGYPNDASKPLDADVTIDRFSDLPAALERALNVIKSERRLALLELNIAVANTL